MSHVLSAVSSENVNQVVRQKSVDVGSKRLTSLSDLSNSQQHAISQGPKLPAGNNLVVPRKRFAGPSGSLNSVSSLNSVFESASTTLLKCVEDIDAEDTGNPQLVSVYVKDVYAYLRLMENRYFIRQSYMTASGAKPEITPRMRTILVDWLLQVHSRFGLLQETLFLTVDLLDRYLQEKIMEVGRKRLQLVGITAMWVAAKYEEIYAPEVNDFVYITDNAYSSVEMRMMEIDILNTLKFNLGRPLSLHFLRRNSKAGEMDSMQHALAKFFMEVVLQEYPFVHVLPSLRAAAALWLAIKLEPGSSEGWSDTLVHYSGYGENDLIHIAVHIAKIVVKLPEAKHNFIFSKYQSSKHMKLSTTSYILGPAIKKLAALTI